MSLSLYIQSRIKKLYADKILSISGVSTKLNLPESTVVYYLKKHGIQRRTRSEAINHLYVTRFGKKPYKLKQSLSPKDQKLKTAAIMLYWGEGTKGRDTVCFTNSNPEMIRIFLLFLREICGVSEERLRALVHAYPDHDLNYLENFWSKTTGIVPENFNRAYLHIGKKGTYKNKSQYGTISISYSDKKLLDQILFWIEEFKKEFGK